MELLITTNKARYGIYIQEVCRDTYWNKLDKCYEVESQGIDSYKLLYCYDKTEKCNKIEPPEDVDDLLDKFKDEIVDLKIEGVVDMEITINK